MFERVDPQFEPSTQTREAMLYVRKKPMLISGISHPGLFGVHAYTVDWVMFILVLILEAIGLYAFYNALEQSDTSIFTAMMATGAMFLVDLVSAFYHHRFFTGINSKLEIESVLASKKVGTDANLSMQNNQDMVRGRKNKAFIFSMLLILFAALKFGIFYMLNEGNGEIEYGVIAFMALAYLVAAIIHIKVTGYLVHAVWANWLYGRDEKKFKSSNGTICRATEYTIELEHHPEYADGLSVRTHEVVKVIPAGTKKPTYLLKSTGILMDKDIEEFSYKLMNEAAKNHLVLKAMELQIRMV